MSFNAIANLIRRTFKTLIADIIPLDTAYDNSPYERPNGVHALVMITPNTSTQQSLGATKRYRNLGSLVVNLFDKAEAGDGTLLERADTIAAAFRTKTYSSGGQSVHFRTPSIQRVGIVSDQGNQGSWWQINVICPYYADILV